MLVKRVQGQTEKLNGFYYEYDMHSKPVGEGGMGVVYKGYKVFESTGIKSVVAIKVMFDDLPADVYKRAEREASIRMRNDNLVEMFGFISVRETEPYGNVKTKYYVISEFLNGVVLSELLTGNFKDKDGIEIAAAKQLYNQYITDREKTSVEIIKSILSGIMVLHDRGYIHRDIDPTNIMVTDKGNIKLIDFGIAKKLKNLGNQKNSLTSNGRFIGKAEFASPELVLGDVSNQGVHTDIYAIGILMYRLLVGRLPFTGSKYDVLQKQLGSKVPVGDIKNRLLRKIVKKATEKNRNYRHSSIAELRFELDNAMAASQSIVGWFVKYGVATLLLGAACVAGVLWVNSVPEPESSAPSDDNVPVTQLAYDYSEDFSNALSMLDSGNEVEAEKGFAMMKVLADKNHIPAVYEMGATYCTWNKSLTSKLRDRRNVLGMNKEMSLDSSIMYLKRISTEQGAPVEALYLLGVGYWRQQKWPEGIEILNKAEKKLLDIDSETINGYSREQLQEDISSYLFECRKEARK